MSVVQEHVCMSIDIIVVVAVAVEVDQVRCIGHEGNEPTRSRDGRPAAAVVTLAINTGLRDSNARAIAEERCSCDIS